MNCPHYINSDHETKKRIHRTVLVLGVASASAASMNYGTPFNSLEVPTDITMVLLLCRLRYMHEFWDGGIFPVRGFEFTHETVRDWENTAKPPLFAEQLRAKRKGKVGTSLVRGRNLPGSAEVVLFPYRAIDRDGNSKGLMRGAGSARSGEKRHEAAQAFFLDADVVIEKLPERVTTDGVQKFIQSHYRSVRTDVFTARQVIAKPDYPCRTIADTAATIQCCVWGIWV